MPNLFLTSVVIMCRAVWCYVVVDVIALMCVSLSLHRATLSCIHWKLLCREWEHVSAFSEPLRVLHR
jgi:hypothetical protein